MNFESSSSGLPHRRAYGHRHEDLSCFFVMVGHQIYSTVTRLIFISTRIEAIIGSLAHRVCTRIDSHLHLTWAWLCCCYIAAALRLWIGPKLSLDLSFGYFGSAGSLASYLASSFGFITSCWDCTELWTGNNHQNDHGHHMNCSSGILLLSSFFNSGIPFVI